MASDECTYVDCAEPGVGRIADTSGHWLCQGHLDSLQEAITASANGDEGATKRLIGMTIRAGGGAAVMTDRMAHSIHAGGHMLRSLMKGKPDDE